MTTTTKPYILHVLLEEGEICIEFATRWDATCWLTKTENNLDHSLTAWLENTETGELIFDL